MLSTSKLYRIEGNLHAFLPIFLDRDDFYTASDPDFTADTFVAQLGFLKANWRAPGRPTVTILLTEALVGRWRHLMGKQPGRRNLLAVLVQAKAGRVGDVRVRLGRMQEMIGTACIESLDFLTRRVGTSEDWKRILSGKASFDATVPKEKLQVSLNSTIRMRTRSRNLSGTREFAGRVGLPNDAKVDTFLSSTVKLKPLNLTLSSSSSLTSPAPATPGGSGLPTSIPHDPLTPGTAALSELPTSYLSAPASNYLAPKVDDLGAVIEAADADADERWALKEHEAGTVDITPDTLMLDLNDPSRVDEAIEELKESNSLFDQCDLLQYLKAVKGDDFRVEGAGSVEELLEQVYQQASTLGLWNVVRQAAGLLKKALSGISYHVIDLLVRGLPITIGRGDKEFMITSTGRGMKEQNAPSVLNSDALRDTIYEHALEPREGAAALEIIMALADTSRSSPLLLEGVARLRISLIIDALAYELGRTYNCPYQEGIERLMQHSPTELRILLRRLLETHDHCSIPHSVTPIHIQTAKAARLGNLELESDLLSNPPRAISPTLPPNTRVSKLPKTLVISAKSASEPAGNFATIEVLVDGELRPLPDSCRISSWSRGLFVVIVDATLGIITFAGIFDTHASASESDDLAMIIEELKDGEVVGMAVKDDCTEHLNQRAITAIEHRLGSKLIDEVAFRDSFVLAGRAGTPGSCVEQRVSGLEARPTDKLELKVDMAEVRENIDFLKIADLEAFATSSSLAMIAPTLGEWYRRRAVDGSLNRVPEGFYRKVGFLHRWGRMFASEFLFPASCSFRE